MHVRQRDLIQIFREQQVVDPCDYPQGVPLRLLAETARLYERRGLLSSTKPEPLWRCCSYGRECWAKAAKPRRGSRVNDGTITLPWIGPDYLPGGVVVIAINLHNASRVLTEYEIVCSSASSQETLSQISSFEAGRKKAHGSLFAYGSVRSAAMLLDVLDGIAITDRADPTELVTPLNRIARLQSVKCAPDDDRRGTPTTAMVRNCPPLLLGDELSILKPRIILTVGRSATQAVRNVPGYETIPSRGVVKTATIPIADEICTVYSVAHPASAGAWQTGHATLRRHLRRSRHR